MGDLLDYAPIAAAAFAIPQFLPQLLKLRATDDTAGVSWSWAALTSVNNAAWLLYFALARYWTALVPAASATLLAGTLAIMLAQRGQAKVRPAVLIGSWVALLLAGLVVAGRTGLGTLLTVAFILQVTPSIWTAYRTAHLTGVARGTWLLILGELSCWTIFGVHKADPRLITLGVTGVTASGLMLARIRRTRRNEPLRSADADARSSRSRSRARCRRDRARRACTSTPGPCRPAPVGPPRRARGARPDSGGTWRRPGHARTWRPGRDCPSASDGRQPPRREVSATPACG
jgi:uncharacterized protein with PQ loop repeat